MPPKKKNAVQWDRFHRTILKPLALGILSPWAHLFKRYKAAAMARSRFAAAEAALIGKEGSRDVS